MFQSSPTSRGGRYNTAFCRAFECPGFQSSPTSRGGRYSRPVCTMDRTIPCFNPRPPLEVGATAVETFYDSKHPRFNPRPPLEVGATGEREPPARDQDSFNPRPPLEVGATNGFKVMCVVVGFQSSPTSRGGRYSITKIRQSFR